MTGDLLIYPTAAILLAAGAYCLWKRVPGWRTFLILCFILYASMVLEVTLFPIPISFTEIARFRSDPSLYVSPDLNLAPFRSIIASARGLEAFGSSVFVRNWLGNMLLLLPLGVMAPLIWNRYRNARQAMSLFIVVSLSIEFAQYIGSFLVFKIRWKSVDVDDLIVNVIGALLGFLLAKVLIRVGRTRRRRGAGRVLPDPGRDRRGERLDRDARAEEQSAGARVRRYCEGKRILVSPGRADLQLLCPPPPGTEGSSS